MLSSCTASSYPHSFCFLDVLCYRVNIVVAFGVGGMYIAPLVEWYCDCRLLGLCQHVDASCPRFPQIVHVLDFPYPYPLSLSLPCPCGHLIFLFLFLFFLHLLARTVFVKLVDLNAQVDLPEE